MGQLSSCCRPKPVTAPAKITHPSLTPNQTAFLKAPKGRHPRRDPHEKPHQFRHRHHAGDISQTADLWLPVATADIARLKLVARCHALFVLVRLHLTGGKKAAMILF
ncbi:hypothetical protein M422DRAFT_256539 [Sphaerobolus stellatus SS14]|uniref:Uncharacterized protein n=1 Tax=Sphaerobolus stellatus (strain SS14) TaxID=990650 RepID=A0A0C9VRG4_SPHS4|nr:hypothetical protein M422DRAFT_256539 [Sphaerobolus stellatus SS14]